MVIGQQEQNFLKELEQVSETIVAWAKDKLASGVSLPEIKTALKKAMDECGRGTTAQTVILPSIPYASTNEKLIVGKLVTDLLAAGYAIDVFDGEEDAIVNSTDASAIFKAMCSTDMDRLDLTKNKKHMGWVLLIWGNDADVISDYTTNLEAIMKPVNEFVNSLEAR